MQNVFQVYSDPGHGWAKVPRSVLRMLCIEDQITHYSYERGTFAYLEEDCDLSLFIKAYRGMFGRDPVFRESSTNKYSKIRGYNRYRAPDLAETRRRNSQAIDQAVESIKTWLQENAPTKNQ